MVTLLELFGGFFLLVGFLVPVVAFAFALQFIAIIMMKATRMNAGLMGAEGRPSFELDFTYLLLSLAILLMGAGAYSIDASIGLL